jgi:hypothetical protein
MCYVQLTIWLLKTKETSEPAVILQILNLGNTAKEIFWPQDKM